MLRKILTAFLVMAGCTRPYRDPCEPAGKSGNQLSATLLQIYDQSSTLALYQGVTPILAGSAVPSCCGLDGLQVGSVIALSVSPHRYSVPMGDGGCWLYGGALQSPLPGLQVTPEPRMISASGGGATVSAGGPSIVITYVQGSASVNGCSGYWLLAFEAPGDAANGGTFGAPTPDALPPAAVTRFFVADSPQACPVLPDPGNGNAPACADTWIAQLTCVDGPCRS
jgi:hypothetical protein